MNYYEHHLGDWAAATSHLTWDEDMAYTRLLRAYYHNEKAIPDGQQYRLAKATTPVQRRAVDTVLAEFFSLVDGHYHQKRADDEIARFQDKQRKAKASANARWTQTKRNANASPDAMRTHSDGNALQTPDSRLQTPNQSDGLKGRGPETPFRDLPPAERAAALERGFAKQRRLAAAIGFRMPLPGETLDCYRAKVAEAQQHGPSAPLQLVRDLAAGKRA